MNKNINKNESGHSVLVIILILLILIAVVSGASYYLLKSSGRAPIFPFDTTTDETIDESEQLPVSEDDGIDTLELELESTLTTTPESDLKELETDASSL